MPRYSRSEDTGRVRIWRPPREEAERKPEKKGTSKTRTPEPAAPPRRESPAFRSPIEVNLTNAIEGYRRTTGMLPGPDKLMYAIQNAPPNVMTDEEWATKLWSVDVTALEAWQRSALRAGDILYKGKPKVDWNQVDPLSRVVDKVVEWSHPGSGPVGGTMMKLVEGDKMKALTMPTLRPIQSMLGLPDGQKDTVFDFMRNRGFLPKQPNVFTGQPTTAGPISEQGQYADMLNQYYFAANVADAVILKKPEAIERVRESGLVPAGMDPIAYLNSLQGVNDEDYRKFIYELSVKARPEGVSEQFYASWFSKRFGKDWLPQNARAALRADQDGFINGFIGLGAATLAVPGYIGDELVKNLTPVKQGYAAPLAATLGDMFGTSLRKAGEVGVKGLEKFNEGTVIAALWGRDFASLVPTALTPEELMGSTRLINSVVDAYKKQQADRESESPQYTNAVDVALRDMGIDPLEVYPLPQIMTIIHDTALGGVSDMAIGAAARGALNTKTAAAVGDSIGVHSAAHAISKIDSPYRIMDFYNVDAEGALKLAAMTDKNDIAFWMKNEGAAYFGQGKSWTPWSPSLSATRHMKAVMDETKTPFERSLLLPLNDEPVDLLHEGAARGYKKAIHAGMDEKTARDWADQMVRYQADPTPTGARNRERWWYTLDGNPHTGAPGMIEDHLAAQAASDAYRFPTKADAIVGKLVGKQRRGKTRRVRTKDGATKTVAVEEETGWFDTKPRPTATKLDEYHNFRHSLRGREAAVVGDVPTYSYHPIRDPITGEPTEGSIVMSGTAQKAAKERAIELHQEQVAARQELIDTDAAIKAEMERLAKEEEALARPYTPGELVAELDDLDRSIPGLKGAEQAAARKRADLLRREAERQKLAVPGAQMEIPAAQLTPADRIAMQRQAARLRHDRDSLLNPEMVEVPRGASPRMQRWKKLIEDLERRKSVAWQKSDRFTRKAYGSKRAAESALEEESKYYAGLRVKRTKQGWVVEQEETVGMGWTDQLEKQLQRAKDRYQKAEEAWSLEGTTKTVDITTPEGRRAAGAAGSRIGTKRYKNAQATLEKLRSGKVTKQELDDIVDEYGLTTPASWEPFETPAFKQQVKDRRKQVEDWLHWYERTDPEKSAAIVADIEKELAKVDRKLADIDALEKFAKAEADLRGALARMKAGEDVDIDPLMRAYEEADKAAKDVTRREAKLNKALGRKTEPLVLKSEQPPQWEPAPAVKLPKGFDPEAVDTKGRYVVYHGTRSGTGSVTPKGARGGTNSERLRSIRERGLLPSDTVDRATLTTSADEASGYAASGYAAEGLANDELGFLVRFSIPADEVDRYLTAAPRTRTERGRFGHGVKESVPAKYITGVARVRPGETSAELVGRMPSVRGAGAERTAPLVQRTAPYSKLDELKSRRAGVVRKFRDARNRRQRFVSDLQNWTAREHGEVAPPTEAGFAKTVYPRHDDSDLAIFNGGEKMRKWSLMQEEWHINRLNSVFRKIILWRNATMLNIIYGDEGFRSILNGVNPFRFLPHKEGASPLTRGFRSKVTEEISTEINDSSLLRNEIAGMIDPEKYPAGRRPSYTRISPGHELYPSALKHTLTQTAETRPYKDWVEGFRKSVEKQLGHKVDDEELFALSDERVINQAVEDAKDHLRNKVAHDDFYIASAPGKKGMLEEGGWVVDPYLSRMGLQSNVDDWIELVHNRSARMAYNSTTRKHLVLGRKGLAKKEAANPAVQAVYGDITAVQPGKSIGRKTIAGKGASAVFNAPFNLLNVLTRVQRREVFAHFWEEKMKHLEGLPAWKTATAERKHAAATSYALRRTEALSYFGTRTLMEENLRNISMFLPAYKQFMKYWAPMVGKHPFTTMAVYHNWNELSEGKFAVPDYIPILGGITQESFRNLGFFNVMTPESPMRIFPPVAPTVTVPLEFLAIGGSEEAAEAFRTLSGGFEPAGPYNRAIDNGIYSLLGLLSPDTGLKAYTAATSVLPGTKKINESRQRAVLAQVVLQAITGKPLDAKAAARKIAAVEGTRGLVSWTVPGTLSRVLPKVKIVNEGKVETLDFAEMAQAQYDYLTAPSKEAERAVIEAHPLYAVIAKAWTLKGDAQMEWLSEHKWAIPFITRRRQGTVEEKPLIGPTTTDYLDPQIVVDEIRRKQQDVAKWELKGILQSGQEATKKLFAMDMAERGIKPGTDAYKTAEQWQLPDYMRKFYNKFAANNRAKLIDALGVEKLDEDPKSKVPMFVDALRADTYTMERSTYEAMKKLDDTNLPYAESLLANNPYYDTYKEMRSEEREAMKRASVRASLITYKSDLGPEDWDALNIPHTGKDGEALIEFTKMIDSYLAPGGKLKRLTFGTDEYWETYAEMKEKIEKAKVSSEAKEVLTKSTGQLLTRAGISTFDIGVLPHGERKTKATARILTDFNHLKQTFNAPGDTLGKTKAQFQEASPQAQVAFKEYLRAGAWEAIIGVGEVYRESLGTMESFVGSNGRTYYAVGGGRGFSLGSTPGKQYDTIMENVIQLIRKAVGDLTGEDVIGQDIEAYFGSRNISHALLTW